MRKLFTLFLAIVASVSAFAEIYSGTCGNGLNWSVDTKTGVLNISGEGTYNYSPYGYTPEEPWNSYKSQISILKLGAGVQSISPYYFYRCVLDSIFVDSENPSYVAQDSVLFNKNKTTLVLYARNHRGSYEVPSGVTAIGDYAFYGSLLSEVILQGSVTTLGTYAFAGMSYLTNVVLSEGLTRIGDHCFYFSSYLKTINIPNSLTYVGDYAFSAYQSKIAAPLYNDRLFVFMPPLSMSSYSIPEGIQEICAHAFYDNYILSEILLPKSLKKIDKCAFYNCSNLKSINIPDSVTDIGSSAFYNCTSLSSIYFGVSIITIGNYMLENCNALRSVVWNAKHCSDGYSYSKSTPFSYESSYANYDLRPQITSFVFGDSVEYIPAYLCYGMNKIPHTEISCFIDLGKDALTNSNFVQAGVSHTLLPDTMICAGEMICEGEKKCTYSYSYWEEFEESQYEWNKEEFIRNGYEDAVCYNCGECSYSEEDYEGSKCWEFDMWVYSHKKNVSNLSECPDGENCTETCPGCKKYYYNDVITHTYKNVAGCDSIVTQNVLMKSVVKPSIEARHEMDELNTGSIIIKNTAESKYDYFMIDTARYEYEAAKYSLVISGLSARTYELIFYYDCATPVYEYVTISRYGINIDGIYYKFNDYSGTASVTYRGTTDNSYSDEYKGDIVIPEKVSFEEKEYKVTEINSNAFAGCGKVNTVSIPSSVKSIGIGAFQFCVNLDTVFMNPTTPPSEGRYAFYIQDGPAEPTFFVPFGCTAKYKQYNSTWRERKYVQPYLFQNFSVSPTSYTNNFTSNVEIDSVGIEGGENFAGNVLEYIGLEPNSEYKDIPVVLTANTGETETINISFKTEALTLTTKESKPVSETTALLFAETNMSDAETNCGFEWKRTTAPDEMAGTKVFCPVASGMMAGRLKNLKDDVYYKYRAFYQSAAGQMYYGEWQYIFTGDVTVEFDPVLYTYSATVVKETEATISGYALAGAADFTEQGFEYWAESRAEAQGSKGAMKRMPAALGEHFFVQASGINMRVTLTDLDPGTVYKYRAYGKVGEQVYYGAEQSFTTRGTYVAPSYLITFLNWDGTELQKSQVATGTIPEYNGETPVRPDDEQYTYIFKGWTPELVAVTADAVYTAEFYAEEATAIGNVQTPKVQCTKLIENGVLYLIFNGTKYNVQGQVVK